MFFCLKTCRLLFFFLVFVYYRATHTIALLAKWTMYVRC